MKYLLIIIGILVSITLLNKSSLFDDKVLFSSDSHSKILEDGNDEQIIYMSHLNGREELCKINPDGTGYAQLTRNAARSEYQPHFSSDNKFITFNTYRYGGWKLAKSDVNFKNVEKLVKKTVGYEYDASWSSDDKKVVYIGFNNGNSGKRQIFIADADGGNSRVLTKGYEDKKHYAPVFSPTNELIYFYADTENGAYDIFSMKADGSNRKNLTQSSNTHDFVPAISPKNDKLAYYRLDNSNNINIIVLDLKTNAKTNITEIANFKSPLNNWELPFFAYGLDWNPAGDTLVFSSSADGDLDIYTIKDDGSSLKKLTNNTWADAQPDWSN